MRASSHGAPAVVTWELRFGIGKLKGAILQAVIADFPSFGPVIVNARGHEHGGIAEAKLAHVCRQGTFTPSDPGIAKACGV
jgi:hypothetical protein